MGTFSFCTAKTMMGFLGLVFFVSGIACVAIGSIVVNRYYSTLSSLESFSMLQVPAILLIFVGIVFFIAGCAGCCNLFKESKGCLASFFTFLFVIVALMILAAILGVVYRNEINDKLEDTLNRTLKEYNENNSTKRAIDDMQQQFHCCGIHNSSDWKHSHYKTPDSCYEDKNPQGKLFEDGCYSKLQNFINTNFGYIITGSVILLIVLVLGMMGACALLCYKKNDNYFTLS